MHSIIFIIFTVILGILTKEFKMSTETELNDQNINKVENEGSSKIDVSDLVVKVYGASNIGKVRQENQDSFYLDGKYLHKFQGDDDYQLTENADVNQLYAVFDGLGGEEGGAVSSKIACETMKEFQDKLTHTKLDELYDAFCDYATVANRKICKELHSYLYPRGGTTFVAIQISEGALHPFYLGDSRIYMGFHDQFFLVSEDHTVAGAKVRAGEMTEEEAMMSPENHMLTNFLGDQPGTKHIDVAANAGIKMQDGLFALMCSDGLHDIVPPSVIFSILKDSEDPANELVKMALELGGYDNVTPVVIRIEKK